MTDPHTFANQREMLEGASDKRLELAYEAGQKALGIQDSTLDNVRTRANYLLASAALIMGFSAGLLIHTSTRKHEVLDWWKALSLLVVLVALAILVFVVLRPLRAWYFAPSAKEIMDKFDQDISEKSILKDITDEMIKGTEKNRELLDEKQNVFKFAVALLVVEVGLLLAFNVL